MNYRLKFATRYDAGKKKIQDIKDFRSLFLDPITGYSLIGLTFAKNFIESLYDQKELELELSGEYVAVALYNQARLDLYADGWYIEPKFTVVPPPPATPKVVTLELNS